MHLETKRLILRDLDFSDRHSFFEYGRCPKVGPNAGWKPFLSQAISDRVLSGLILSKETYAIALKETNRCIGTISLYHTTLRKYSKVRSLGFSLHEDYWNQGLMTEAVKAIVDYAFTKTDCEILEAGHHIGNTASKRVIEKCGFLYDGTFCSYKKLYDGRLIDADFYSLKRSEYERMKEQWKTN